MGENQYTKIFNFKSSKDRNTAKKLSKGKLVENRIARRALMLMLRYKGVPQTEIAEKLDVTPKTVGFWENRYNNEGIDGLYDKPGRGRKPSFSP